MATNTSDSRYNLLSEPEDDLICLICLEVAEEPWQHGECGRLLCKKCLDELGKDQPCPNCRKAKPQYFQDSRSKSLFCNSKGRELITPYTDTEIKLLDQSIKPQNVQWELEIIIVMAFKKPFLLSFYK